MVKKFMLVLIVLMLFPAFYVFASESELPHITVIGEARELIAPDQMSWNLLIKNEGRSIQSVAKNHAKIVKDLISFLKQSKIQTDKIQTSSIQLAENWIYKKGSRVKEGYFASAVVVFKTGDLKKYEPLWIGLSSKKHLSIQNVRYELSDQTSYFNRIRSQALANAKFKAEAMASALDADIGEPLVIEEGLANVEQPRQHGRFAQTEMLAAAPSSDGPMSMPGLIPVRLNVRVKFRLISINNQ